MELYTRAEARMQRQVCSYASWDAQEYYRMYYGQDVLPDDRVMLAHHINVLGRAAGRYPHALEYGCGPTLLRAIAAATYVASLDLADRLETNLNLVRAWRDRQECAHDWSLFTRYVLACEGIGDPTQEQIEAREDATRMIIRDVLPTDATQPCPLGPERVGYYDLLLSGFCLDCISTSKDIWRRCMRNVLGMLKPGGTLLLAALDRSKAYRVLDRWYPAADVDAGDLHACLIENGFASGSIDVESVSFPEHRSSGFEGILLVSGEKAK